jgi:hypothetical protein
MLRPCQLIALVGLLLSLSGCSTIVSSKPEIDGSLIAPCKPLPDAQIAVGDDIRIAAPKHLAIVAKMYNDCAAQLTNLVDAVK